MAYCRRRIGNIFIKNAIKKLRGREGEMLGLGLSVAGAARRNRPVGIVIDKRESGGLFCPRIINILHPAAREAANMLSGDAAAYRRGSTR